MEVIKKEVEVIMLPTKNKLSNIIVDKKGTILYRPKWLLLNIPDERNLNIRGYISQYLYFVSDEEIKEGDWVYIEESKKILQIGNKPHQVTIDEETTKEDCKKIIGTTDPKLKYTDHRISPVTNFVEFPKPSTSFIQAFCNQQGVYKILVDYEEYDKCCKCETDYLICDHYDKIITSKKLIIDQIHNTFAVHKINFKTFTLEQVNDLVDTAWIQGSDFGSFKHLIEAKKQHKAFKEDNNLI